MSMKKVRDSERHRHFIISTTNYYCVLVLYSVLVRTIISDPWMGRAYDEAAR